MEYDVINLSVKEEMRDEEVKGKHKAKTLAYKLVESLLKNDPDEVRTVIRYINTRTNEVYMSEKLLDVQRLANSFLEDLPEELKEYAGGNDWQLSFASPFSKLVKTEKFNEEEGYEDTIKVQEVKFYLKEKTDLTDFSEVRLSVSDESSNAGSVASRILRNMVVDKRNTKLTFILSKHNKKEMCSKLVSLFRIIGRMAKEPGVQIHESLPVDRKNVKIRMEGPYIKKMESDNGRNVFVQEYGFFLE